MMVLTVRYRDLEFELEVSNDNIYLPSQKIFVEKEGYDLKFTIDKELELKVLYNFSIIATFTYEIKTKSCSDEFLEEFVRELKRGIDYLYEQAEKIIKKDEELAHRLACVLQRHGFKIESVE